MDAARARTPYSLQQYLEYKGYRKNEEDVSICDRLINQCIPPPLTTQDGTIALNVHLTAVDAVVPAPPVETEAINEAIGPSEEV